MKEGQIKLPPILKANGRTPGIPTPLEARFQDRLLLEENHSNRRSTPSSNGRLHLPGHAHGNPKFKIVVIGLSVTSSWGNGHATTYRGLIRELHERGHEVHFLERDAEWYASNRDMPKPAFCKVSLYENLAELKSRHAADVQNADVVIVGSYVPQGKEVGEWVVRTAKGATGFYDIDTPVTLSNLLKGDLDYLSAGLISKYDMYLSFSGGPALGLLEDKYGSPMARPLYCSVDTALYYPEQTPIKYDLGYMGTYSDDRQPALDELLLEPARNWEEGRFIVAGPQYPKQIRWPRNVRRKTHLPPARHRSFYCSQGFTLNVTRADMVEAGYSPSVRLFEAAACGTPIISDYWEGIEAFFTPNEEILISNSSEETLYYLLATSQKERMQVAQRARQKVLSSHTARHRAIELEGYICSVLHPSAIHDE